MLNEFRTLLLNLTYAGDPTEHIPASFAAKVLPAPLQAIYNILFPTISTRYFKLFLAQNYINLVKSAGLEKDLCTLDSRISYIPNTSEFFKIYLNSNPILSNASFPMTVYGQYQGNQTSENYYDSYTVSQVSDTSNIVIFSNVSQVYINGGNTYSSPVSDAQITLSFNSNQVSNAVYIGATGISFTIGGGSTFTGSSDKTWQFVSQAPFSFSFSSIFSNLLNANTNAMFAYNPSLNLSNYQNLWTYHYNPVYRMAGLLLAYVTILSNL